MKQNAFRKSDLTARYRLPGLAMLALAAFLPAPASAATANTTMAVSATVQAACSVSATALAFGTYSPVTVTPLDATSTITVNCTTGTSFTVGLNAGTTGGATVTSRQMVQGANSLNYALYRDSGRSNNWGNTPGTDTTGTLVATTTPTALTVYGRIPALQNVPAGSYTDTVTVTVNY